MELPLSEVDISFLKGQKPVEIEPFSNESAEFGMFFGNGAVLTVECFWRLRNKDIVVVGRDDRKTEYPQSRDAMEELTKHLTGKTVTNAYWFMTDDLVMEFENSIYLDVISSYAIYESWQLSGPNDFMAVGRGW